MGNQRIMQKMTPRRLKEYLKIAKSFDLKFLKIEGVEIGFTDKRVGTAKDFKLDEIPKDDPPTEDDMLYWSSGFDPKEERQLAEQQFQNSLKS